MRNRLVLAIIESAFPLAGSLQLSNKGIYNRTDRITLISCLRFGQAARAGCQSQQCPTASPLINEPCTSCPRTGSPGLPVTLATTYGSVLDAGSDIYIITTE